LENIQGGFTGQWWELKLRISEGQSSNSQRLSGIKKSTSISIKTQEVHTIEIKENQR
jgi:hypothetical protein